MNLEEVNALGETLDPPRMRLRGAVITIHGMNTRGAWQKAVSPVLFDAGLRPSHVDYDTVRFGALRRKTQDMIGEKILEHYEEQRRYYPLPSAIAHSLGSLSLGRLLQRKSAIRLKYVIVHGCILPCDFPWQKLYERDQIKLVLNETGKQDMPVRFTRWVIPESGNAGRDGFKPCPSFVLERPNEWGRHSENHYAAHFRDVWVPFLVHGAVR
ncbi:MAG: serine/threonine protein kinase [Acidobacteria bacterium]|nr:serine/threonine protein kinase [Acidobacteriota bacterium]